MKTLETEANRRESTRFQLEVELGVVDTLTGETIGKVANLHLKGMMLLAHQKPKVNNLYQLRIKAGEATAEATGEIDLGVDCLWAVDAEQEGHAWAGYRIIDMSEEAAEKIEKILDSFGKNFNG